MLFRSHWDRPLSSNYDKIIIEAKYPTYKKALALQREYPQIEIIGDCAGKGHSDLTPNDFTKWGIPDRSFTRWWDYQNNGNFKYLPATYMQSSLDCWYRECTFCSWAQLYPKYQLRSAKVMLDEVRQCIDMGFKEIFDDSGTFPIDYKWLTEFCGGMISQGYNRKIRISCNMRLDYLHPNLQGMRDMRQAGFRMILYGLESANQTTLDKLNKGINIKTAIENIKLSARAGLEPHITCMFGYTWESYDEALKTLKLVHYLLRKGYAKTAQATLVIPYPNTPLYKEAKERGALLINDWEQYDMSQPVLACDSRVPALRHKIYDVGYHPEFWFRRIIAIRNMADLRYLWKGIKKALSR